MPYALSFAPDFFWGDGSIPPEDLPRNDRPTSVAQAIASLSQETWNALAREVFGVDGAHLDLPTVLAKVMETNTCRNLDPPVEPGSVLGI